MLFTVIPDRIMLAGAAEYKDPTKHTDCHVPFNREDETVSRTLIYFWCTCYTQNSFTRSRRTVMFLSTGRMRLYPEL